VGEIRIFDAVIRFGMCTLAYRHFSGEVLYLTSEVVGHMDAGGHFMSIKVLLADDAEITRRAIVKLLSAEPKIELVGEACDFAQTVQMAKGLKPQVIVMDLHVAAKPNLAPIDVKANLNHGSRLVTISFANDEDCKALAQSFGAVRLLDKMTLAKELIPTILHLV